MSDCVECKAKQANLEFARELNEQLHARIRILNKQLDYVSALAIECLTLASDPTLRAKLLLIQANARAYEIHALQTDKIQRDNPR